MLDDAAKEATPLRDQLSKTRTAIADAIQAKKSDDEIAQAVNAYAASRSALQNPHGDCRRHPGQEKRRRNRPGRQRLRRFAISSPKPARRLPTPSRPRKATTKSPRPSTPTPLRDQLSKTRTAIADATQEKKSDDEIAQAVNAYAASRSALQNPHGDCRRHPGEEKRRRNRPGRQRLRRFAISSPKPARRLPTPSR